VPIYVVDYICGGTLEVATQQATVRSWPPAKSFFWKGGRMQGNQLQKYSAAGAPHKSKEGMVRDNHFDPAITK
jgi:hypothetical protein